VIASKYQGAIWLTGRHIQQHPGEVDLDGDRMRVYIAGQVVGDWPRSEVRIVDAGSHFEISAEGDTLGFATEAGAAFRVAIAGGLADRIAQVTGGRDEVSPAQASGIQVLRKSASTAKKPRRWPWIVGGLILIGAIANASDEDRSSGTTLTPSATTSRSAGSAEQSCQDYSISLLPILADVVDASSSGADAATAAGEGSISFSQAATIFRRTAEKIATSARDLQDLGTPPPPLEEAISYFSDALSAYEEAYETAALAADLIDADLLDEGRRGILDGNALVTLATEAIGDC
jgi:hypothetical protein